jgi:hypothetical protein
VHIDDAYLPHQLFQVVETMNTKKVVGQCLSAHNIDEAANSMVDQLCVLMYPIRVSCDYLLEFFISPQVVTLFTSSISLNHAST